MSNPPFACVDCSSDTRYPSVEELEIHIASDHLNYCPYECDRCRFAKFPTEFALISHYESDHGLREFYVRFRYNPEIKRKTAELRQKLSASIRSSTPRGADFPSASNWPVPMQLPNGTEKVEDDSDSFSSSAERVPSQPGQDGGACAVSPASVNTQMHNQQQQQIINQFASSNFANSSFSNVQQPNLPSALFDSSNNPSQNSADNKAFAHSAVSTTGKAPSPLDLTSEAFNNTGAVNFNAIIGEAQAEEMLKKPKDVVTCQVCGLKVSNQRSSLVYHANTKHIKLNLYECTVCQKTWQTIAKSDVVKHVRAMHNGDESMIIDNRKRLGYQLRICTAKCFPPKPNNKPRPLTQGTSPPRVGGSGDLSHQLQQPSPGMNFNSGSSAEILNSFLVPKVEDPYKEVQQMHSYDNSQVHSDGGMQQRNGNSFEGGANSEMLGDEDGHDHEMDESSGDGQQDQQQQQHNNMMMVNGSS